MFVLQRKDTSSGFHGLRLAIMQQLRSVLPPSGEKQVLAEDQVVEACAFIKLYCAMKSIAAMRWVCCLGTGIFYFILFYVMGKGGTKL